MNSIIQLLEGSKQYVRKPEQTKVSKIEMIRRNTAISWDYGIRVKFGFSKIT